MSPDILYQIEMMISDKKIINEKHTKKFIELIRPYKKDDILYPGYIQRRIGINVKEMYNILSALEDAGYVEPNFEVYCHDCDKHQCTYKLLSEIPKRIYCGWCEEELNKETSLIVVYRVINDGYN